MPQVEAPLCALSPLVCTRCQPCAYGSNAEKLGGSCFGSCCLWFFCGNWMPCCLTGKWLWMARYSLCVGGRPLRQCKHAGSTSVVCLPAHIVKRTNAWLRA